MTCRLQLYHVAWRDKPLRRHDVYVAWRAVLVMQIVRAAMRSAAMHCSSHPHNDTAAKKCEYISLLRVLSVTQGLAVYWGMYLRQAQNTPY